MKNEFIFDVEEDDGLLVAVCHEPEMATQAETLDELLTMIRDLLHCRFGETDSRLGWPIRLHFLQDSVVTAQVA